MGPKSLSCLNYYTNEEITIPLDPQLSALDNARKYFDKYNKLNGHMMPYQNILWKQK